MVEQVVCPVCRDVLNYDMDSLTTSALPADDQFQAQLTDDIRQIQHKMAALFEKQKAKGGIIDVEAEKNKYYLALVSFIHLEKNHQTMKASDCQEAVWLALCHGWCWCPVRPFRLYPDEFCRRRRQVLWKQNKQKSLWEMQ